MTEKVIVLGEGFVGSTFRRLGYKVIGREVYGDVTDIIGNIDAFHNITDIKNADVIINCIGISDTRYCEDRKNWKQVHVVNGIWPTVLSMYCDQNCKKLVHISTGCLYEGTEGKKTEDSPLETHCAYTVSKLVGELGCNPDRDIIVRPRLLFDIVDSPKNLLTKFGRFEYFLNEFNTVTSTTTIVESVEALILNKCVGTYNVGNLGTYTIYEMAEAFGIKPSGMITQKELIDTAGIHLVNNVMDMTKLINDTGYIPSDALEEIELCSKFL